MCQESWSATSSSIYIRRDKTQILESFLGQQSKTQGTIGLLERFIDIEKDKVITKDAFHPISK